MALHFVAGRAEYSGRGDDPNFSSLGAGLYFCRPERPWRILFLQNYEYSLLGFFGIFSEPLTFRLPLFSVYTRPPSYTGGGCSADTSDPTNRRCRNFVARH